MIRGMTDVKRRVMTHPFVVRNHKPLHAWFAMALFLAGALASSDVTAAVGEQFCTHGGQDPQKGDSVACYSDVTWCGTGAQLQPEPCAVCSRARQDHRHYHIVFRLDHSNQESGRLMPQNLAAEPKSTLRWRTLAQGVASPP